MIDTETIIAGNKMDFQNALNAAEHDPEQKISARRCSSGTSKEVTVYSIVYLWVQPSQYALLVYAFNIQNWYTVYFSMFSTGIQCSSPN